MLAILRAGPWLLGFVLRSKCSQSTGRQEDGEPFPQADALPEDARCNQEGAALLPIRNRPVAWVRHHAVW